MFALKLFVCVFPKVPTNKSITAQRGTYVLMGRELSPSEVSVPQETRSKQDFVWELKSIHVRVKRKRSHVRWPWAGHRVTIHGARLRGFGLDRFL